MPRVSVIIPVYNEAASVEEVVRRVRATGVVDEIIAVDDGSTDRSPEVLARLAIDGLAPPVQVVRQANAGKGAAVRAGYARMTGDIAIIQDADLELDPAEFPRLVEPIAQDRADMVFGVRFRNGRGSASWPGYLGNRAFSVLASILFLRRMNDILTCYKVVRADLARRLDLRGSGFDLDPELACKALLSGCRIVQVPVTYDARTHADGKKQLRIAAGIVTLKTILRVRLTGA